MKDYIKRITDREIEENLGVFGAVCVEGAKWGGKTTSSRQFAKTIIEFHDPVKKVRAIYIY